MYIQAQRVAAWPCSMDEVSMQRQFCLVGADSAVIGRIRNSVYMLSIKSDRDSVVGRRSSINGGPKSGMTD